MDPVEEYHDPDYPEAAVCVKKEPPNLSEEEKVEKIKSIIHREFSNELEARESDVKLIDQRMGYSRRMLHRLRYSIVSKYYMDQKLQLNSAQIQDEIAAQRDPRAKAEISSTLRDGQRQIHKSLRKLLGKDTVDIDEIFRVRGPRNKTRKDYSAMLQKRNYTISADATRSLRPECEPPQPPQSPQPPQPPLPRKVPRHLQPRPHVLTLEEATRNQMKHRYRFIIGNTSKYVPAASRLDRSTHKWLLYIRGAPRAPDPSPLLAGARVTLHHSYAPHHRVQLDKHPFHISRRGWGEFPAKIELHFALPERNKPACVEHNIKLDRNYTGLQTLGSETIVDVWLYSTPEMLQYEYKEDDHTLTDIQAAPTPNPTPVPTLNPNPTLTVNPTPTLNPTPTHNSTPTLDPTPTLAPTFIDPETKIKEEADEQTDWMDFFKTPTELDVDEMFIKPTKDVIVKQELDAVTDFEDKIDPDIKDIENILHVPTEIMNQPASVKKRIVKYIDPTTGKIYYLEMDRELDLTTVQEIIINNRTTKISPIKSNGLKSVRKKKGLSLLKPEVKNQIKSENSIRIDRIKANFPHLENDHCYLHNPKMKCPEVDLEPEIKTERSLYESLVNVMSRFTDVRSAVNYLVRRIPLISQQARDPDFLEHFPFVVESGERYWRLDYAKRRNIEWSRAKLINKLLSAHYRHGSAWRTKQILLYVRLHGHYPTRNEPGPSAEADWPWGNAGSEASIKEMYPNAADISSLSTFKFDIDSSVNDAIELSDDEDIDVLSNDARVTAKRERPATSDLQVLPVEDGDDRLRFQYIERKCADIGIELRNEDVGNGYSYSAVHAVLLSAMKSFAEEMVRGALAEKRMQESPGGVPSIWTGTSSSRSAVRLAHAWRGARRVRVRMLSAADLAAPARDYCAL